MTTGIFGIYSSEPLFKTIVANNFINPDGGVNPVDVGPVSLKNVRGQLSFTIISGDNGFTSSFQVDGGVIGTFQGQECSNQNFYFVELTNVNCVVTTPFVNTIDITTPVADAGGRTYRITFFPFSSVGPTIQRTAGALIGNNTLSVRVTKPSLVQA